MCSTEVLTDALRKREGARGPWCIAPGDATNDQGRTVHDQAAAHMRVRFGDYVATMALALAVAGCGPAAATEHLLVRPAARPGLRQPRRSYGVRHAGPDGQRRSRGSGNLRRGSQDVPVIQGLRAAEDHQAMGGREQPRLEPGASRPEDRVTIGLLPASSWPRCSEELARSPTGCGHFAHTIADLKLRR
jgi:hypothetical protein